MAKFNVFSIPRGVLTEISGSAGSGKTEAVLRYLAQNPEFRVAWIEENLSVYPPAFPQNGVALERTFFVDVAGGGEKVALWCAQQILASQLFKVVVVNVRVTDTVALRRLQLAAEKSQVAVILLSEYATAGASWPIHLQLAASRDPSSGELRLAVLRNKRGSREGLRLIEGGAWQSA